MRSKSSPYISDEVLEHETSQTMHWREAVAIIIERAWMGLAVAVAVFLLFWYQSYRQVPFYRSVATLMVEAQIPQIFSFQDMLSFNTRNLEYYNTHLKALHSRSMMEHAIAHGQLAERPGFTPGTGPGPRQAVDALQYVNISPVERSRMINIVVEHPDPAIAADLANALGQAYIQQDLDNRMGMSLQAVDWLRSRADEYRGNLEQGLSELQHYREETQSVSLEEDQNIVIAKLKALNLALTEAQTARIHAQTQWEAVQQQMEAGRPATDVVLALNNVMVQEVYADVIERQRNLQAVAQRYRSGHPDYQTAADDLQAAQSRFDQAAQRALAAIESEYDMAVLREQNLSAALREQEQEAFELDRKLVRYNDLKRNVEADQEVYQAVISRMKEASLSGSLPTEMIRIAEVAEPAERPFRPNPRQAMVRGGAVGLALGLMAIFVLYYADHRYRRAEEVERSLGVPVLGNLPLIRSKTIRERGLITHTDDTGTVAESFRTLRASLMMDATIQGAKRWLISSAGPGEGKSLVAINLAISLAQDGNRTLLIGADLRRPSLHKVFELDSKVGLAEILKGEVKPGAAVVSSLVENLDILPAGRVPSHPAELLGKQEFPKVMKSLIQAYDRVIIDAPPMLGVSDSLILLGHADIVLFVVRYGITHSLSARYAVNKVKSSGIPCMGAILNGVNLRNMANYYYYRRYGGYGYEYGQAKADRANTQRVAEG
jgi:polysaccharide biosynthesis transport protein